MTVSPLHIGVLGAARIVQTALLAPARATDHVRVTALAARDPERASRYAARHGIERVHAGYESLLADPAIDAVYIPLPPALHAEWTLAAIDAGKHVLVEKPFTSNAAAARTVAARAALAPTVVMEAYHSHYHPLHRRLREIVDSGELGRLVSAESWFCVPIRPGTDIRWNLALGGGGLLDVGYYPVRLLRELFAADPTVLEARAWVREDIDRLLTAELDFGGVRGRIRSAMWSRFLGMGLEVVGEAGRMKVSFPFHPHVGAKVRVRGADGVRVETTSRTPTFQWQLAAFRDAIEGGVGPDTDAAAAVDQMQVLDSIYSAAGMTLRP